MIVGESGPRTSSICLNPRFTSRTKRGRAARRGLGHRDRGSAPLSPLNSFDQPSSSRRGTPAIRPGIGASGRGGWRCVIAPRSLPSVGFGQSQRVVHHAIHTASIAGFRARRSRPCTADGRRHEPIRPGTGNQGRIGSRVGLPRDRRGVTGSCRHSQSAAEDDGPPTRHPRAIASPMGIGRFSGSR